MSLQRWCLRTSFSFFPCINKVSRSLTVDVKGRREKKKFIIKEATRLRTFALLKVLIETLTFQSNGSKMIQRERLGRWDVVEGMDWFIRSWKWVDFGGRVGFLWKSLSEIIEQTSKKSIQKTSWKASFRKKNSKKPLKISKLALNLI